jgi:hypothetical protein
VASVTSYGSTLRDVEELKYITEDYLWLRYEQRSSGIGVVPLCYDVGFEG